MKPQENLGFGKLGKERGNEIVFVNDGELGGYFLPLQHVAHHPQHGCAEGED